MFKIFRALVLVVMCVLLACIYGIVHDLITAHMCIEYFSVYHPMIIEALYNDPIANAFMWGILATWWVGLVAGLLFAGILTLRWKGRYRIRRVFLDILKVFRNTFICAGISGCLGFALGSAGYLRVPTHVHYPLSDHPPPQSLAGPLYFDVFAHSASYLIGAVLLLRLARQLWKESPGSGDG